MIINLNEGIGQLVYEPSNEVRTFIDDCVNKEGETSCLVGEFLLELDMPEEIQKPILDYVYEWKDSTLTDFSKVLFEDISFQMNRRPHNIKWDEWIYTPTRKVSDYIYNVVIDQRMIELYEYVMEQASNYNHLLKYSQVLNAMLYEMMDYAIMEICHLILIMVVDDAGDQFIDNETDEAPPNWVIEMSVSDINAIGINAQNLTTDRIIDAIKNNVSGWTNKDEDIESIRDVVSHEMGVIFHILINRLLTERYNKSSSDLSEPERKYSLSPEFDQYIHNILLSDTDLVIITAKIVMATDRCIDTIIVKNPMHILYGLIPQIIRDEASIVIEDFLNILNTSYQHRDDNNFDVHQYINGVLANRLYPQQINELVMTPDDSSTVSASNKDKRNMMY